MIIQKLNERFGTDFAEADRVFVRHFEERLDDNQALKASVAVNTPANLRLTFDHVVADLLQEMVDTNFKFYKQVTDDHAFADVFLSLLFDRYLARAGQS